MDWEKCIEKQRKIIIVFIGKEQTQKKKERERRGGREKYREKRQNITNEKKLIAHLYLSVALYCPVMKETERVQDKLNE